MKEFLLPYNSNITVIPTSVDTGKFRPLPQKAFTKERVTLGWIGSHTTLPFLFGLRDIFKKIAKNHKFILKIVGGDRDVGIEGIDIINERWSLSKDVENFQSIDIGVYPMLNNEWARAKTPFKTIQYMSVGVPCVVSRVWANRDIVKDGVNGYLAETEEEWIEKISMLIGSKELRKRIGMSGRETVFNKYSLDVNAPKFLDVLKKVYNNI